MLYVLGSISIKNTHVVCIMRLHFIDRKNVRIVFATLSLCTMPGQSIVSIRFFCDCLLFCGMHFPWNVTFIHSHSPILFSGYIKFIDPSRTFAARSPFINESHKSGIFILIKWTSHFSTEKGMAKTTQIAYQIAHILFVLIDFNGIGI